MSDISKIEINGKTYDIKDEVARESGGGDSKIVHGSFGEFGEVNLTGAGMIILCGDNSKISIYRFHGRSVYEISTSDTTAYSFESTSDGLEIYDNYGFTETLYTIIYV